jgi:hypothetical protein
MIDYIRHKIITLNNWVYLTPKFKPGDRVDIIKGDFHIPSGYVMGNALVYKIDYGVFLDEIHYRVVYKKDGNYKPHKDYQNMELNFIENSYELVHEDDLKYSKKYKRQEFLEELLT